MQRTRFSTKPNSSPVLSCNFCHYDDENDDDHHDDDDDNDDGSDGDHDGDELTHLACARVAGEASKMENLESFVLEMDSVSHPQNQNHHPFHPHQQQNHHHYPHHHHEHNEPDLRLVLSNRTEL